MLLVTILLGFISFSSVLCRQFHFVSESKSWSEAQSHCRTFYTDLATLYNTDDLNTLTQLGPQTGSAWIGLYYDPNSWRWSIDNSSFYGPGETTYRNWSPNEPSNASGIERCVEMYATGVWNDIICTTTRSFVCYGGKDSYTLIKTAMTWFDAQTHCRTNYIDLTSVRNAIENEKVRVVANGTAVFIGLYRTRTWSDRSYSSFRHWTSGQPTNSYARDCTAMLFSNSDTFKATLRMVVDTEDDLTEAEIEEIILKPFREELLQNGLPNSTTLSLRRVHRINP
ncbi:putative C-type lectin domain family 20 member A isoform X2 [Sardina pilchardus]|uniref:putative C-type lectin domain family 20 member A isoform X2 n=1 Tax=Sardina pilchardus TaxID=27697 RepID=UPI002E153CFA